MNHQEQPKAVMQMNKAKAMSKKIATIMLLTSLLLNFFSSMSYGETITQEKDTTYWLLDLGVIHAWKHSNGLWQNGIEPNIEKTYTYNNIINIPPNAKNVSVTVYPKELVKNVYNTNGYSVSSSEVTFNGNPFIYNIFDERYDTDSFYIKYSEVLAKSINFDSPYSALTNYNEDTGAVSWEYDMTFDSEQAYNVANAMREIKNEYASTPYNNVYFDNIASYIGYDQAKEIYDKMNASLHQNVEGYFVFVPLIIKYTVTETTTIEIKETPTEQPVTEVDIPDDIEILLPEIEEFEQKTRDNIWIFSEYGTFKFLSPYEDIKYHYEGVQPFSREMYDEIDVNEVLTTHKVSAEGKTVIKESGTGIANLHYEADFYINPYEDYRQTKGDIDLRATISSPFGSDTKTLETDLYTLPDITANADFELVYASTGDFADYGDTYIVKEGAKVDINNLGTATDLYRSGMQVQYDVLPYKDGKPNYFIDDYKSWSKKKNGDNTYFYKSKTYTLDPAQDHSQFGFDWIVDRHNSKLNDSRTVSVSRAYLYIYRQEKIYPYRDRFDTNARIDTYERDTIEMQLGAYVNSYARTRGERTYRKNKYVNKEDEWDSDGDWADGSIIWLDAEVLNRWSTSGSNKNKVRGYSASMNKASLKLYQRPVYNNEVEKYLEQYPQYKDDVMLSRLTEKYPYEDIEITQTIQANILARNKASGGYQFQAVDTMSKMIMFYGEDSILTVRHKKMDENDKIIEEEIEHIRVKYNPGEIEKQVNITLKDFGDYVCTEAEPVLRAVAKGVHKETDVIYKLENPIKIIAKEDQKEIKMKSGYGFKVIVELEAEPVESSHEILINPQSEAIFLGKSYKLEETSRKIEDNKIIIEVQVEPNQESPFLYRKIYTDVALADGSYSTQIKILLDIKDSEKIIEINKPIQIKGHMYEDYYSH